MAHEFESGMMVKKEAWHKLGVVVETAPSPARAMEIAQMNWLVDKRELTYETPQGGHMRCDNHYALVRDIDNRCLGYCSNQYEIWQNWQAFEWTQPLFESGLWEMETCGSLKKGEICWILLKQGEGEILPGDKLKQYLLMTWAHNGRMPNLIQPTSIRVVCNNTLMQAMGETKPVRICHYNSLPMTMQYVQGWKSAKNCTATPQKNGRSCRPVGRPPTRTVSTVSSGSCSTRLPAATSWTATMPTTSTMPLRS